MELHNKSKDIFDFKKWVEERSDKDKLPPPILTQKDTFLNIFRMYIFVTLYSTLSK